MWLRETTTFCIITIGVHSNVLLRLHQFPRLSTNLVIQAGLPWTSSILCVTLSYTMQPVHPFSLHSLLLGRTLSQFSETRGSSRVCSRSHLTNMKVMVWGLLPPYSFENYRRCRRRRNWKRYFPRRVPRQSARIRCRRLIIHFHPTVTPLSWATLVSVYCLKCSAVFTRRAWMTWLKCIHNCWCRKKIAAAASTRFRALSWNHREFYETKWHGRLIVHLLRFCH